jgi:hypothetical protein
MSFAGVESARKRARLVSVCDSVVAEQSSQHMRVRRFSPSMTHRVHPLVAPSVGWAKVAVTFNCLIAAPKERLVLAAATRPADPLDIGAVVIVRHAARAVCILDFRVVCMAPDTVEEWGWSERREKGGKCDEGVGWRRGNMVEHVCVERLRGDGSNECM